MRLLQFLTFLSLCCSCFTIITNDLACKSWIMGKLGDCQYDLNPDNIFYYYVTETNSCLYVNPTLVTFTKAKQECQACGGRLFMGIEQINSKSLFLRDAAEVDTDLHPRILKKGFDFWTGVEFQGVGEYSKTNFSVKYHLPNSHISLGLNEASRYINVDIGSNIDYCDGCKSNADAGNVFQVHWSEKKEAIQLAYSKTTDNIKARYLCEFVFCPDYRMEGSLQLQTEVLPSAMFPIGNEYEIGTKLELQCPQRQTIVNNTVTCGPHGQWMGQPECIDQSSKSIHDQCTDPPQSSQLKNGTVDDDEQMGKTLMATLINEMFSDLHILGDKQNHQHNTTMDNCTNATKEYPKLYDILAGNASFESFQQSNDGETEENDKDSDDEDNFEDDDFGWEYDYTYTDQIYYYFSEYMMEPPDLIKVSPFMALFLLILNTAAMYLLCWYHSKWQIVQEQHGVVKKTRKQRKIM